MNFRLIVSSTDSYSDAWAPFFALLRKYWPDGYESSLLVTDTLTKVEGHPEIEVLAVQTILGQRGTWAENIRAAIEFVDAPLVVYMQEDYFLEATPDAGLLAQAQHLVRSGVADCVQLVDIGPQVGGPTDMPAWAWVSPQSKDLVSLQASIWRPELLFDVLRSRENPWQFESFGSARARKRGFRVAALRSDLMGAHGSLAMPYKPTGIVHGKWFREVVEPLFSREQLEVSYARGFFEPEDVQAGRWRPVGRFRTLVERLKYLDLRDGLRR